MKTKSETNRIKKIIAALKEKYPEAKIALQFSDPFELLISTILSAQCTDERVNKVTGLLFKKYKTPRDFLNVEVEKLEKDIFSTGFYKQKAKSIKACCEVLATKFNGIVPKNINDLISLPGVGRKTASVVLGNGFGISAIAVDTHVKSLSNLLKLVDSDDADKIEEFLKVIIPKDDWIIFGHLLMNHGRATCVARRPKCGECIIAEYCPSKKET
jgi:endonuclease-3